MRAAIWTLLLTGQLLAADPVQKTAAKPETFLVLPEPRVMRSALSSSFAGARHTVFTPAHRTADGRVQLTSKEEFAKLGISWESFLERAQAAADRRLAELEPEIKKDATGRVLYAVYRGEDPSIACLLIAPALATIFKNILGEEVWLVAPDRNSLFIFPARKDMIQEFGDDLRERFEENPFAVSDEVFAVKPGVEPRVVGNFTGPG